jgi:hypothetical protein
LSILNVYVQDKYALVGVDTHMNDAHGAPLCEVSKMIPLVHLNAVIACRGDIQFFLGAFGVALLSYIQNVFSFDQLFESMNELLGALYRQQVTMFSKGGWSPADVEKLASESVLLVGWSESRRRFVAREFRQDTASEGFYVQEINPQHIAPWDEEIDRLPYPKSEEHMERLATAQVQLLRTKAPGTSAGGRLMIARLEHGGMSIGARRL